MRCQGCGAEVMLGSAQCHRCGRSLLDGTVPPVGSPAPPPPPPSPTLAPPPQRGPAPAVRVGSAVRSGGLGCVSLVLLVSLLAGGVVFVVTRGGSEAVDAIRDAVESGDGDGFDGDRVGRGSVAVDAPVEASIGDGEVGVHPLAPVEGRVTIGVAGRDSFDPVLRVVDAGGSVLGEDDDGGSGTDSRLSLTLAGGTAVTLEIHEFGDEAGDYVITVQRGDDEVGITPIAGPALGLGSSTTGAVGQGAVVAHPFVGVGRRVRITVEGLDGFDPVLLVRSGDQVLGENDDADGRNSRLELDVPEGAEVSVQVSGFAGQAGSYRVLIT